MEHRLHKRAAVEWRVRLVVGGKSAGISRTTDMSSGGVRIKNPGVELKPGALVHIDFIRPGFPRGVNCYVRAMVIHCSSAAIGLMFAQEFPAGTFAAMIANAPASVESLPGHMQNARG